MLSLFLMTGCSKETKFKSVDRTITGFHKVNVAEKIDDGVLYFKGDKILYDKDGTVIKIADKVSSLWRENDDIYYDSSNVLYSFNFETQKTNKLVDKPHRILGKYNGNIITYCGKTIYSINGTKKTKLFKDGYYLNKAVLYKNKVYGIPASNVYEYNLDTLKVKKITKNPYHSDFEVINGQLYIITEEEKKERINYTYSKLTDDGLEKLFDIKNITWISDKKTIKDGMFLVTSKSYSDSVKGNQLLYVKDGRKIVVDKNYSYDIVGIINNKLCYYKNKYNYGNYDENLKTFYLYDGKKSIKAFDLDLGFFEDITGYEYDGGLVIKVSYESSTQLYKYDGKEVLVLDTPENFYSIMGLDIIDNKAYIKYSQGEESMDALGTIIDLDQKNKYKKLQFIEQKNALFLIDVVIESTDGNETEKNWK